MKSKNTPWLSRTGQTWKVWISLGISCIALVLFILMVASFGNSGDEILGRLGIDELQVLSAFLCLGLLALFFLVFSVKCPECKKRPVYKIIRTSDFNQWFYVLISFDRCPNCGYMGKQKR
jgi:hypothetical protein